MDLEIFSHIDEVISLYENKRDIYKLIAEEVQDFFQSQVFDKSKYTLTMVYRIKSVDSIREKLLRNSYISQYNGGEQILAHFQDIIGFRIECRFIDDERYVFELIRSLFTSSDDGQYYYIPENPKIQLKLSESQPQKQKNGFNIYKLDGLFWMGKESVKFELQIKALVNTFWGEIEHRIIYKNNSYLIADSFVSDLMTSIKKSLNMIDGQLYVLYKHFKRAEGVDFERDNGLAIERFISKMVYDTFSGIMRQQIGFAIDFKASCDAVVRYIMVVNNAQDMEDYGRVMLNVFYILNSAQEGDVRVDSQLEFERGIYFEDDFSKNILETVLRLININYRWHLFFMVLFVLERGSNAEDLESFIAYYKNELLKNRSLSMLDELKDAARIRFDILTAISQVFRERQKVEYLCDAGIKAIHRSINATVPLILDELDDGRTWDDCKEELLTILKEKVASFK